jgi:hypothetical protein
MAAGMVVGVMQAACSACDGDRRVEVGVAKVLRLPQAEGSLCAHVGCDSRRQCGYVGSAVWGNTEIISSGTSCMHLQASRHEAALVSRLPSVVDLLLGWALDPQLPPAAR